jgi:hypothetical protein
MGATKVSQYMDILNKSSNQSIQRITKSYAIFAKQKYAPLLPTR